MLSIRVILIALALGMSSLASAQTPSQPPAASSDQLLKAEELDQLVAPIALYPDSLLAEVLMASTYPLEVVEADRWVTQNKKLTGDALKAAVDKQSWDDSIKSLTATPAALAMMSQKLDWTQKLGDAVLAQQADLMDAVQRLRKKAQANKQLETTKEQKVSTRTEQNKEVIVIEPSQPNTVYVPYYNPAVVYGAWPYPAYPPYYWPAPPGYYAGAAIATGVAFGVGFAVGAWAADGGWWGGGFNWGHNDININNNININANKNFIHNSDHRHGVRYNNANVAQKFDKHANIGNRNDRIDFRGHDGKPVLNPDRNRPGAGGGGQQLRPDGDRPGAKGGADRPGAKGGDRPGAKGGGQQSRPGGDHPRPQSRDTGFSHVEPRAHAQHAGDRGRGSVGGSPHISGGGGRGGGGAHIGGGGGHRGGGHAGGGGHRGGRR